ncbi:MAG: hypothetical protein ACR2O3_09645 [Rhizobiaceae bacterium]
MVEKDLEASDIERKVHDLAEAMSRLRNAQADRDDVVVDMKHAKFSRLQLLAEDISQVFEDIPEDNEQFEFALTNGETPRLWIDMTSFVRMGADGREYEFVKDTRLGRTILGRSTRRGIIGKAITDYVAERILERERMIEGDWISARALMPEQAEGHDEYETDAREETITDSRLRAENSTSSVLTWLFSGLAIGLAIVLAVVAVDQLDPVINWLRDSAN